MSRCEVFGRFSNRERHHNRTYSRVDWLVTMLMSLISIASVVAALAVGSYAQTYSAAAGFSATTNSDTSRWSYRYNTTGTRDGDYALLPLAADSPTTLYEWGKIVPVAVWRLPSSDPQACPCIAANIFKVPLVANYGFGPIIFPARSIFVHPSTTSTVGDTVLSFLVPKTGTVTITYKFTDIDPYGGNGIRWYIDLNSGLSGDLVSGKVDSKPGLYGSTETTNLQVAVVEGDRLNFIVDSNGDFDFDSTAVKVSVTY